MKVNKIVQFVGRLITAIVIIGVTAFFTPGFTISSIWVVALSIVILTLIDFFISSFTKLFYHPYIKLIIGFVLSGITLFLLQYIVIGYTLSFLPIVLGAIVYGLVDYMLPSEDDASK